MWWGGGGVAVKEFRLIKEERAKNCSEGERKMEIVRNFREKGMATGVDDEKKKEREKTAKRHKNHYTCK